LNADLLDGLDSTQFTLTSSFAAQTASFTAFTASVNSFTASQLVLNGTYATTGSNTFAGIQTINSNLVVTGSITAQTLVVQTITSSVDFVTGSTRFGSILGNTHQFTGSVNITGSLNTNNTLYVSSSNVGIGTSIPSQPLQLGLVSVIAQDQNSMYVGANFANAVDGNYIKAQYANQIHFDSAAGNINFKVAGTGSVGAAITYTTAMRITSVGNVGIGTTSPATERKLTVAGGGQFTYGDNAGAALNIVPGATGQAGADFNLSYYTGTGFGPLTFTLAGSERMRISSDGNVEMQGTNSSAKFKFWRIYSNNQPGFSVYNTSGTEILYFNGNNSSLGINGDLNLSGSAEINHTGRMLFDAGAGNGFLFRVDNVATQALSIASTGIATFPISVVSSKFNTFNGSLSVANNTATFMQACGGDNGTGSIFLIVAAIGGAGSERIAMGILVTISQGGGTARWAFQNDGANMFLTDPGSNGNIYVRHTAGGTSTVSYSILRIA
jgi:hypothetical protein